MRLHAEETEAGPWRRVDDDGLRAILTRLLLDTRGVLLVDGRSGSGESTFAERARLLFGGAVVHSDDLAWHHDAVAWDELAIDHVIGPWRRGEDVDFRPPGWVAKGREGSVMAPADGRVLIVEGVGAGRASLAAHADAVVWVLSDLDLARERGLRRDVELGRSPAEAEEFWDEWMQAEEPFLTHARPWEHADFVVNGTPVDGHSGGTLFALAPNRT
jgi:hypothetical protein